MVENRAKGCSRPSKLLPADTACLLCPACTMTPLVELTSLGRPLVAYVPLGPQKQLEMFFHSMDLIRQGREEVR